MAPGPFSPSVGPSTVHHQSPIFLEPPTWPLSGQNGVQLDHYGTPNGGCLPRTLSEGALHQPTPKQNPNLLKPNTPNFQSNGNSNGINSRNFQPTQPSQNAVRQIIKYKQNYRFLALDWNFTQRVVYQNHQRDEYFKEVKVDSSTEFRVNFKQKLREYCYRSAYSHVL